MGTPSKWRVIAAWLALLVLCACEQSATPTVAHVTRASAGPAMAMAVVSGSTLAPIEAHFNVPAAPVLNAPFKVELIVTAGAAAPVMTLEVSGEEGLQILTPSAPLSFDKLAAGRDVQVTIEAQASTAGAHLVHAVAVMGLPNGPQSKTFVLPVLVISTP
jgi:hypothetical protein